tara:strand:- start:3467 stop:4426 length:960 start_codon:yes stop_codon:yes gene_type:complete
MEYFDRKEEVIDLKLTPYGKRLLSLGRLKPVYYAFYDDDVVYDTAYGGYTEMQKEAEDRIKSTPRTKAQTFLDGIESRFTEINETFDESEIDKKLLKLKRPSSTENIYGLPTPIGNGSVNSDYAPAWDIRSLQCPITASSEVLTGSHGIVRIPQININAYYDTSIGQVTEGDAQPEGNVPGKISPGSGESDVLTVSKIYSDGTFIKVVKDYILLDIKEINGVLDKENFELEVYKIIDNPNGEERLSRLRFLKDGIEIQHDDIIYDPNLKDDVNLTEKYVEYFFDLRVDNEIEKPLLSETQKQVISLPTSDEEPCLDEPI